MKFLVHVCIQVLDLSVYQSFSIGFRVFNSHARIQVSDMGSDCVVEQSEESPSNIGVHHIIVGHMITARLPKNMYKNNFHLKQRALRMMKTTVEEIIKLHSFFSTYTIFFRTPISTYM